MKFAYKCKINIGLIVYEFTSHCYLTHKKYNGKHESVLY